MKVGTRLCALGSYQRAFTSDKRAFATFRVSKNLHTLIFSPPYRARKKRHSSLSRDKCKHSVLLSVEKNLLIRYTKVPSEKIEKSLRKERERVSKIQVLPSETLASHSSSASRSIFKFIWHHMNFQLFDTRCFR
jgi:hypothetical protein